MSRGRTPFPHGLLLGLVATLTTWAALTSWHSLLVRSADYLAPLLVCGAIIAVTGAALRRFALPSYAVVAAQAVLATGFVVDHLVGTIAPTGKTLRAVGAVLDSAVTSARTYAAPIGVDVPSIAPLLIVSGAVFLLVVDVLACTLHRIPIAGLALLAVYTIPAGLTESGPGWLAFLGAATGFLVLLHLDTRDQLMRWGRPLGPPESSGWSDANPLTDAVRAGAGRIGLMAVAFALVVPTFLPVLDLELLGLGPGDGDDEIRIRKPIADMRRDLERGLDIPLLRIETDDPDPDYLRISVLNRFTGVEWSSGDRDVAGEDRADGALPEPDGLSPDVPRSTYDYDIDINDDFDSTWLPTQFPATEVRADGDWRFDRDTMDFLAVGDDLTTADLSYSLTAIDPDYGTTGEYFRNATTDDVDDEVLDVPGGLPSEVRSYAQSVTSGARNDYERALLLQRWFRRDGGFRYNVNKAPAGTGGSTFETFLNPVEGGRVGYCEQFASAMAIMARTLGIPSRVAVGFLRPDPVGDDDGLWEYSSHDLHAWPELYFDGAGWVRFEPTPSLRAPTVPDYARVPVRGVDPVDPTATAVDEPTRNTGPAQPSTAAPTNRAAADEKADKNASGDDGGGRRTLLIVLCTTVLVLVALGGLALAPRAVRGRVRRRRLAGGAEDVWDELRATAIDLGVPWPVGRSPRQVGAVLLEHLGDPADPSPPERPHHGADADPDGADALRRIVDRIERTRYARPGSDVGAPSADLTDDATRCVAALEAGVPRRTRNRAEWFPRSLVPGRAGTDESGREPVSAGR